MWAVCQEFSTDYPRHYPDRTLSIRAHRLRRRVPIAGNESGAPTSKDNELGRSNRRLAEAPATWLQNRRGPLADAGRIASAIATRPSACLTNSALVCLLKTINGIHSPEEAICSLHPSGSPSADKDHGLLVPQRDHRIHPHSAARREITGQQGDQRQ
jgi:hypothetical protein